MNMAQFLGLYVLPFVVMALLTVYFAWADIRQRRTIKRLKTIIENTKHKQYVREYGYDLDECKDIHLAGDCPLCGAR